MYTTDDLHRALAEAAEGQTTRLSFAEVKRAAARRRPRTVLAGIAIALTPVLATGGALALAQSDPGPSPTPIMPTTAAVLGLSGSASPIIPVDPSFPVPADVRIIRTGLQFGDHEELVLWRMDEANGVLGGLYDPATGQVRKLSPTGAARPGRFGYVVDELDDRHGGILDYGIFGGTDVTIKVQAGGQTVPATTAPVPGLDGAVVYWARRGGVIAGPTSAVNPPAPDAVFTAYAGGESVLDVTKEIQRADTIVNLDDSEKPIGDRIRTGITMADGGELVFWFAGDERSARMYSGSDNGRGAVNNQKVEGNLSRPPFASGFYLGYTTIAGVMGGRTALMVVYVGPAVRVEMAGAGAEHKGSAAWSAHPQLHLAWASGITGRPSALAYDASGQVVAVTDFNR